MTVDVDRTASRIRNRARSPTAGATAHADASAMSARAEELNLRVPPGSEVPQDLIVANDHFSHGQDDPDRCETALTPISGGAQVEVTVLLEDQIFDQRTVCVGAAEAGLLAREKKVQAVFTAPSDPGVYDMTIEFTLAGSNETFATIDADLVVDGDAPEPPEPDPDPVNGNGGGDWLPDLNIGGVTIPSIAIISGSLALVVLILAIQF